MDWKSFLSEAYQRIVDKKMLPKRELDEFLRKYKCNENILNIGYSLWRINFYHPMTTVDWWKTFFRELYAFVTKLSGKSRKEIIPYGNKFCNKYNDNEITKLYYHIILEIEKK